AGQAPSTWHLDSDPPNLHYRATLQSKGAFAGKLAVAVDRDSSPSAAGMALLSQEIEAKALRGKRVRVAARVQLKAKKVSGEAFVFAQVHAGNGGRRVKWERAAESKKWGEVAVEVDVPADAEALSVGVVLTGGVTVKVDELSVAPVEKAK